MPYYGGSSFAGGDVAGATGFPNGTVAAPSIYWTSDNDGTGAGFWRPAANNIGVATNGIELARFEADAFRLGAGAGKGLYFTSGAGATANDDQFRITGNVTGSPLMLGVRDAGTRTLTIVDSGDVQSGFNFAPATASNPTVKIYAAAAGTTTWGSLAHDGTNFVLSTGAGNLSLTPTTNITTSPWVQQTSSRTMLAADFTNATTTFSNTALSITVTSGRKYTFVAELFVDNATDSNGGKIDFDGGTATATNFRADCFEVSTVLDNNTQVTALATDIVATTITGSGRWSCAGSFEPSSTGTFIIRAASNGGATTFTMFRGSYLWMEDVT